MNPQAGPPPSEPRNQNWLVWVGLAALVLLGGGLASKGSPLLVMALLGGLIAIGTFLRPELGAFVCLVAICTDEVGYFVIRISGYPLTTPKLAVAMLIVCWTLHALVYRKPLLSTTPVTTGLVAVVVSMLVTMMVSGNFSWGLLDTQSVFILAIFVHYAYISIRPERMWTFTLYATGFILLLLTYTVYDGRTAERMGAGYGDPNGWGSAVILMCHLASGALLASRSRWATSLLIVLLGLYVTSIFQTASRSTFLAAVAVTPLGLWGMASKPRVPLLAGILALVLVPLLVSDPAYLYQRLESAFSGEASTSRTEGGIMGRIFLAQYALETFTENPIFGGGPGYIRGTTAEYFHTKGSRDAHNSYLQMLAEQGWWASSATATWPSFWFGSGLSPTGRRGRAKSGSCCTS